MSLPPHFLRQSTSIKPRALTHVASLALRVPVTTFQSWNHRWAATSIQHFHGILTSEQQALSHRSFHSLIKPRDLSTDAETSLFLMATKYSIMWAGHNLFNQPSPDGHLDYFQFLLLRTMQFLGFYLCTCRTITVGCCRDQRTH